MYEEYGDSGKERWIKRDKIHLGPYQRELDVNLVANIHKNFNWTLFGRIEVIDMNDGTYENMDGQHREAGTPKNIEEVPAVVYAYLSEKERSKFFDGKNNKRRKPTRAQTLKAKVLSEDEDAVFVSNLLKMYPTKFSKGCIGEMLMQVKVDKEALKAAWKLAADMCEEGEEISSTLQRAFYHLEHNLENNKSITDSALENFLKKSGENTLKHKAKAHAGITGTDGQAVWAHGIMDWANANGFSLKLPEIKRRKKKERK